MLNRNAPQEHPGPSVMVTMAGTSPGARSTRADTSGRPPPRTTRRSTPTNTANSPAPAASANHPHSGQPSSRPRISGTTKSSTAGVSTARPAGSRPPPRRTPSAGSTRGPAASTAAPIGTFTRNTARQPRPNRSASTSSPPAIWPTTTPPPITAAYRPSARARAAPVKFRWIMLITCGVSIAALAPWANRNATSRPVDGATPHASEAAVNAARPTRNMRRGPARSPSRAPVISRTA
ncbi:hypothetical protein GCM10022416_62760 [Actinomadura keratinilytica]|uniref:Uncharacterized protein n=1 Tax=Actinomadura keratinilytica TaxID=547461 RepID=A0ABP6UJA9_9ACTN